ncbi:MAG: suppressor of fused domain protein [Clostridia bacterium]|nr:suppressor of fused domain protein [Clostridia bacterium]
MAAELSISQMDEITRFISEKFGDDEGHILHELYSDYVHTDAIILKNKTGGHTIVTFGMSSCGIKSPIDYYNHIELVIEASGRFDMKSKNGMLIANELVGLTKYPFRNNTWFGEGHTVLASKAFRETFGYDAFLLEDVQSFAEIDGIGTVSFLSLIPIYKEEREWMMEYDSLIYLGLLKRIYGENIYCADVKRDLYIPSEDDLQLGILTRLLKIDLKTAEELIAYADSKGTELTYESIDEWFKLNKADK